MPIENIRAALRLAMAARGVKGKPLSRLAGISETAVRDLLDKVEDPRLGTLLKLAAALDIEPASLVGKPLPIVGAIGERGKIDFIKFGDGDEAEEVPHYPGFETKIMVLKVVGDHLFPAYRSGDVVYLSRQDDSPAGHIGDECAVQIHAAHGGEAYLRTLAHGAEPDRYNLRSHADPSDIENVAVEWAAPVLFVMRKRNGKNGEMGDISRPKQK
jgi:repressor LexA